MATIYEDVAQLKEQMTAVQTELTELKDKKAVSLFSGHFTGTGDIQLTESVTNFKFIAVRYGLAGNPSVRTTIALPTHWNLAFLLPLANDLTGVKGVVRINVGTGTNKVLVTENIKIDVQEILGIK